MEGADLVRMLPLIGALGAVIAATVYIKRGGCKGNVNKSIEKDKAKVVHSFDMEDLGDKAAFCRCWRSKKFPYCDGSHNEHNKTTGDNVGPLCLSKKAPSAS